jgi:DNA polymerase-4
MGPITAICRDCLQEYDARPGLCVTCGSDRMLHHPELGRLDIAHIDCDAFYASVEKRDNPALANKPVLVGGSTRGVVTTACYIARRYGPRSAMPMYKALALCPHAVVIRPDMAKYKRVSGDIRKIFDAATPIVEPLSLDEAFLDLSGTAKLFGRSPAATLAYVAREIERTVRITVSIGLSYNKFLAKIASDFDKPRGFFVIGRGDAVQVLHDLSLSRLPGVGPSLADRLKVDGLFTVGDVQRKSEGEMSIRYGDTGQHLAQLARGIDHRLVRNNRESKSISAETTFDTDISLATELRRRLWPLCERVAERLKAANLAGGTVTLKLKTDRFKLRTRNQKLTSPTQLAESLFRTAEGLLMKEADGKTRFRLIGVGADNLADSSAPAPPMDLFAAAADSEQHHAEIENAMDAVRAKFGKKAIRKGRADA